MDKYKIQERWTLGKIESLIGIFILLVSVVAFFVQVGAIGQELKNVVVDTTIAKEGTLKGRVVNNTKCIEDNEKVSVKKNQEQDIKIVSLQKDVEYIKKNTDKILSILEKQ